MVMKVYIVFLVNIMRSEVNNRIKLHQTSKSILEELSSSAPKNKLNLLESRGSHVISSAINLLESIEENFTPEEADVLMKRFYSAIKNGDPNRFTRQVRKIKEHKE